MNGNILGAVHDALSWTGWAALVGGIVIMAKGKTEQRMTLEQLKQQASQALRDDTREDGVVVDKKRADAFAEVEKLRDYWKGEAARLQENIDKHNAAWAETDMTCMEALAAIKRRAKARQKDREVTPPE